MARVAPGSADALLQFAEPLMDEEEEPPSPAPVPERARAKASLWEAARSRVEALADMTSEDALRIAETCHRNMNIAVTICLVHRTDRNGNAIHKVGLSTSHTPHTALQQLQNHVNRLRDFGNRVRINRQTSQRDCNGDYL